MNYALNILLSLLGHATIQGFVVLLLAAVASCVLARSSAAHRCLIWQAALALMIILPLCSLLLPARSINITGLPAGLTALLGHNTTPEAAVEQPTIIDSRVPSTADPAAASDVAYAAAPAPPVRTLPDGRVCIVLLWASVCLVLLLNTGSAHMRLARLGRKCRIIDDDTVTELLTQVCARLRVRPPQLRAEARAMPMAWGWLRPVILLPPEFAEWPLQRQRIVLLHEAAHIARRDWLMQRIGRAICCLYWFHPAAWIGLSRVKLFAELACDDIVIESGIGAPEYAAELLEIIRTMKHYKPNHSQPEHASVAIARPAQVRGRIRAILKPLGRRDSATRPTVLLAAAAALCLAPLGAIHVFAQGAGSSAGQHSAQSTDGKQSVSSTTSRSGSRSATNTSTRRMIAMLQKQAAHDRAMIAQQQRELNELRTRIAQLASAHYGADQQAALLKAQRDMLDRQIEVLRSQADASRRAQVSAADAGDRASRSVAELEDAAARVQRLKAMADQGAARQADVDEAIRQLDAAKAKSERARAADQDRNATELEALQKSLERKQKLFNAGQLSQEQMEEALTQLDVARTKMSARAARETDVRASAAAAVDVAKAKLQACRAALNAAASTMQRLTSLYAKGAVAQSDVDAAKAQLEQAKANVVVQEAELDAAARKAAGR